MRQSPSDGTLPNPRRKTRSSPPCAECRSRIDLPELRTDRNSAVPSRTDLHTVNLAHVKYVFHYFHAWRGRVARDRNAPRCEPCRLASCTCDRLLRAPPVTASDEASPMLRCITPIARGSTPGNLSRGWWPITPSSARCAGRYERSQARQDTGPVDERLLQTQAGDLNLVRLSHIPDTKQSAKWSLTCGQSTHSGSRNRNGRLIRCACGQYPRPRRYALSRQFFLTDHPFEGGRIVAPAQKERLTRK